VLDALALERRSGHFSLAFVRRDSKVTKEFLSALAAAW
jgi:hypothetical protein